MSKRLLVVAGIILAIAAGLGYAYASPWLIISNVKKAAQVGDVETVNAHVDYPALRESFKAWINAQMMREFAKPEMRDNPFALFGMAIASKLAETLVDAMVTPDAVRMMLDGQRPKPRTAKETGPASTSGHVMSDQTANPEIDTRMGYESRDRFVVTFHEKGDPNDGFALVWHRTGLTTWKLSAVRMPTPAR